MAAADFPALIERHRNCFLAGKTRPVEWREAPLDSLLRGVLARLTS
jgi:hypothetical protein